MKQITRSQTSLHCNALFPLPQFETATSTSFLIGQYELEGDHHRAGQIDLASLEFDPVSKKFSCNTKTTLPLPQCGVFDIVNIDNGSNKNHKNHQKVAAGCTDGAVKIIALNSDETCSNFKLNVENSFKMGDEMVTSCFVFENSEEDEKNNDYFIASTHHQGTISILPSTNKNQQEVFSFEAHEYDAWSIAPGVVTSSSSSSSYVPDRNIFFSGGDDAKMKLWDLRMIQPKKNNGDGNASDEENEDSSSPACQSHCGIFEAGVVTIVPQTPTLLLVGSYDEHVYAIDTRMLASGGGAIGGMGKPGGQKSVLSKLHLAGGGWRFRQISDNVVKNYYSSSDDNKKYFAVAAMQGGSQVFSLNTESNELEATHWPGSSSSSSSSDEAQLIHTKALKLKQQKSSDEEEQDEEIEPLIYDVCQLGQGGKFLGGDSANFASASFYSNEVRFWGV